jgi:hypothetical protein
MHTDMQRCGGDEEGRDVDVKISMQLVCRGGETRVYSATGVGGAGKDHGQVSPIYVQPSKSKEQTLFLFIACHIDFRSTSREQAHVRLSVREGAWGL